MYTSKRPGSKGWPEYLGLTLAGLVMAAFALFVFLVCYIVLSGLWEIAF